MSRNVLAFDVGGTNLRAAVVDESGTIGFQERRATEVERGREDLERRLCEWGRALLERAEAEGRDIARVGLGVPGGITRDGVVSQSPNIPYWNDYPLREILERELGKVVIVENDANAFVAGEFWLGAAREVSHAIGITLGTGVGGGIVLNDRLRRGPDGTAGELGHLIVEPEGRVCGCGGRGCLETFAGARYIRQAFAESGGDPEWSVEQIARAAREGDAAALKVLHDAGRALGIAFAMLINALNPEVIVIGGGVSASWPLLEPTIREEIASRAFRVPAARCRLELAQLGDDAGLLGTAFCALNA